MSGDDLHIRLLRGVARRARAGRVGATDTTEDERREAAQVAEERLASAEARRRPAPSVAPPPKPGPIPHIGELRALSSHAAERVALYRRRMYLGRGEPRRLAELERIAAGARERLTRALARERDER